MLNIGLAGRRGSGKDTAAEYLARKYDYTRVGFADRVKDAALALDPYVGLDNTGDLVRLKWIVQTRGWDEAKQDDEIRRLLQMVGDEAGRQIHGPRTWIDQALAKIDAAPGPVVVSDVRYPNEIDELRRVGFIIVQIVRPANDKQRSEMVDLHASESDLRARCDGTIFNMGTIEDLYTQIDHLLHTRKDAA